MTLLITILIVVGALVAMAPAAMAGHNLGDALLKHAKALPAAASTSVTTEAIDTGKSTQLGSQPGSVEFILSAPALTATMLPDGKTMTYILEQDDDPDFGSAATLNVGSLVQTGASGTGAAATSLRFRLPSTAKRYVRAKATAGADVTDSSAVSMALSARF